MEGGRGGSGLLESDVAWRCCESKGSCLGARRRRGVEPMRGLRIGMGRSWWARRCVVLGYDGLMGGGRGASGLLESDVVARRCCESKDR